MAPLSQTLRRPYKRAAISDQQRRREISLQRQALHRQEAQLNARRLASTVLSLQSSEPQPPLEEEIEEQQPELVESHETQSQFENDSLLVDGGARQACNLKGSAEVRRWFAKQLMLPEWMIDVPHRLCQDWYVCARPAGKRCFVVSANGNTISRLRNGSILHRFPSSLPNGARVKGIAESSQSYCILDCVFHEADQTYYVIDMVCWRGYSYYDCEAEFRFFWLDSKLTETSACDPPSHYHKYRFCPVPRYNCDQNGLYGAYAGTTPYVKDGLLFYNKDAHYHPGNTPLVLVWKDENCSQYVIDTDSNGQIPSQQQVVLELQADGRLTTSDDPPVVFGCLNPEFIQQTGLQTGSLLRFAINDGGITFVDGKLGKADLHYLGKPNRTRPFADSYSKVVFQYLARHSPLRIDDLLSSASSTEDKASDIDMVS